MYYGDEKRLQMARSILPSTWRKGRAWAEKQTIKRGARRRLRMALEVLRRGDENAVEHVDLRAYPDHRIGHVVQARRGRDKLNPFMRWAEAVTRDVPEGARLEAARGLLPGGLIGDHAISHLRHREHFMTEVERARRAAWRRPRQELGEGERLALLRVVLGAPVLRAALWNHLLSRHVAHKWPRARKGVFRVRDQDGRPMPEEPERWMPMGRARPPSLPSAVDEEGMAAFLAQVEEASKVTRRVTVRRRARIALVRERWRGGKRVEEVEVQEGWPNPASHPEWDRALTGFFQAYQDSGGDPGRLGNYLSWRS